MSFRPSVRIYVVCFSKMLQKFRLWSRGVRRVQVGFNRDRWSQLSQLRSREVKSDQVGSRKVRLDQVSSDEDRYSQIRLFGGWGRGWMKLSERFVDRLKQISDEGWNIVNLRLTE